jgi:hypothetical protein
MNRPKVVTDEEWQQARDELLKAEKQTTRALDAVHVADAGAGRGGGRPSAARARSVTHRSMMAIRSASQERRLCCDRLFQPAISQFIYINPGSGSL